MSHLYEAILLPVILLFNCLWCSWILLGSAADSWYPSLGHCNCLPSTELTKVPTFSVQLKVSASVETVGKAKQCVDLPLDRSESASAGSWKSSL